MIHTSNKMDADQIIDHEETAEIDTVYNTNPDTKSKKKTITFYFVKHHRHMDPEIKRKHEMAYLEVNKKNEEIGHYHKDLKSYQEEEKNAKQKLESCARACMYYTSSIEEKRKYLFHLKNALNNKSTVSRVAMQSPEVKRLTKHIQGLKHKVQHVTLKEEKHLIKQMRELHGERDELVALVSSNNKQKQDYIVKYCEDYLYNYKKIPKEKWLQSLTEEIDEKKANQLSFRKKVRHLEHHLEEIDNNITCLVEKMDKATLERDMANELRRKAKKLIDKLNACYHENHGLRNNARHLAAEKDIDALAKLSNSELEKFFMQWNSNESFKYDYIRRVLWSLESRGLSKDGRTRNPDESPILQESLIQWPSPVFK